jgi:hypothetical protein
MKKRTIVLFDTTGEQGARAARLGRLVAVDAFTVVCDEPERHSDGDIYLCHNTQMNDARLTLLGQYATDTERLVVVYTAGRGHEKDDSGVLYRTLESVERMLAWANATWTQMDVRLALNAKDAGDRTRAFTCLAILAQCASVPVAQEAQARQEVWRTDPAEWRRVLGSMPVAYLRRCASEANKVNADKLLAWVFDGDQDTRPDFRRAADELASLG